MTVLCEHLQKMVDDRGYRRDPATGLWLVKTCLGKTGDVLRDTCFKLVPIDAPECFSCRSREFGEVIHHRIDLNTCHYRCQRCKRVTKGCHVNRCGNCNANQGLTLLPPAINVDIYGWNVVNP
jgi:hypothetical protein